MGDMREIRNIVILTGTGLVEEALRGKKGSREPA